MEIFRETHQYDPMFPFILMHKEGWHYSNSKAFHFHDWYELVYVHRGQGIFLINENLLDMNEGDLYIVPGNVLHHTNPDKKDPYLVSVVLFDPKLIQQIQLGESYFYLQSFEQSRKRNHYQVNLRKDQRILWEVRLEQTATEIREGEKGYRHRVLNLLHFMLTELNLIYEGLSSTPLRPSSRSEMWMKDILLYIDDHLSDELTLEKLAKQALVSPAHFSRVFKELMGMHMPEYLNLKRIIKARGMLTEQDLSIPFISDSCGFLSLSHFYRTFRKTFHMTPGEYRKRV